MDYSRLSDIYSNFLTVLIPSHFGGLTKVISLSTTTLIIRDYLSKKLFESLRNPNVAKRYSYLTNNIYKEWGQYEIEWPEYDPVNQTYFNLSKSAKISACLVAYKC